MAGEDRSQSEQIRALLDEVDRVRRESERVTSSADRAMKRAFYPDRRRPQENPLPPERQERRHFP